MKTNLILIFLFCCSAAFAQSYISSEGILNGTTHSMDSAVEERYKATAKKYSELKTYEKRLTLTLDSLQQRIKNEKDELLQARLDIILLLIKNDKANDVYEKMREFGDKAILDINKRVAAPAWFYQLDKEHARLANEFKSIGSEAKFMSDSYNTSNKIERAKLETITKATPYDSLHVIMKMSVGQDGQKSFLEELCKLYKQPVSTENTITEDAITNRIITCGEKTEVFEMKTWSWGGVFCFYNGTTAISVAEYKALSQQSMLNALNYREQHKTGEK